MAYRPGGPIVGFTPSFLPFQAVYQIILVPVRMVNWLFYRIRISGRENLRGLGRAILVSNHTLIMDPAVIAHAIRPRRTWFTMLEETALIPFLGTFVRLLGALPIPEGAGSLLSLQSASARALSLLGLMHFFPEGECYRWSQEIQPFRPGAFLLACPARPSRCPRHHRPARAEVARARRNPRPRQDHPLSPGGDSGDRPASVSAPGAGPARAARGRPVIERRGSGEDAGGYRRARRQPGHLPRQDAAPGPKAACSDAPGRGRRGADRHGHLRRARRLTH